MSLRKLLIVSAVFSALAALVACGGSSNPSPTPPPTGGFSISNLSGTYVFSINGNVADQTSDFIAVTGAFAANGSGAITGGALDMNSTAFSPAVMNNPITGGSYTVTADGRGRVTLNTATPFGSTITLAFVLSSNSHGLVTEFDGNGSGSGSLDLQTSTAQPAAGTYAFGLSGVSNISVTTGGGIPAASAGVVTLDASGNATGSMDYNNNSTPSLLNITSGSVVHSGTSPGSVVLVTTSGTLNFDVYPVSATHLRMIETDGAPILTGDLFSQSSSSFPSGQIAFTMAGEDYPAGGFPLAVGGLMTSDGSSITVGAEDYNDGGTVDTAPLAFAGTITPSNGRYVLQLSSFENGNNGAVGTFSFAAYPSDGGVQVVEIDGAGVTSGAAFSQTSTSLAANQGYGFNLSASNSQGFREDDIAEFSLSSTGFSGIIDINDQGSTNYGQGVSGTYTPDSGSTGAGVFSSSTFTGVYYTVDANNALFIELDSTQLGLGALATQTTSARSNLATQHLQTIRSVRASGKKAWHLK